MAIGRRRFSSVSACRTLAESEYFQGFIMGVIVLTAVLTGLETSAPVRAASARSCTH